MRAKFVNEKFVEDSDPIHDMGIGMLQQIKDYMNKGWNRYRNPDQALSFCVREGKTTFVKFLLDMGADLRTDNDDPIRAAVSFSKTEMIKILRDYAKPIHNDILKMPNTANKLDLIKYYNVPISQKEIIDIILNMKKLSDKLKYSKQFKLTAELTPKEKMQYGVKAGGFDEFKEAIDAGVKLKIANVNSLFKSDWEYNFLPWGQKTKEIEKIIKYLKDNANRLDDFVVPEDKEAIQKMIGIDTTQSQRSYPMGYKIYRLLKAVDEGKITNRGEITKLLFELSHGANSYNPIANSSYWSTNFNTIIYPNIQFDKNIGKFVLTLNGKAKFQTLDKKFKKIKIDPPPYV